MVTSVKLAGNVPVPTVSLGMADWVASNASESVILSFLNVALPDADRDCALTCPAKVALPDASMLATIDWSAPRMRRDAKLDDGVAEAVASNEGSGSRDQK